MPGRAKDRDEAKCGPLVLQVRDWAGGDNPRKTLLLQKPDAEKIHFTKGTLWPVLTIGGRR